MNYVKSIAELDADLAAARAVEAAARARYDELEMASNPDHAAVAAAQDSLGDAVLAEDQAREALEAAVAAEESAARNA